MSDRRKRPVPREERHAELADLILSVGLRPSKFHRGAQEELEELAADAGRRVYERNMRGQIGRRELTHNA